MRQIGLRDFAPPTYLLRRFKASARRFPIRKLLRMGLAAQGYQILEAPNGFFRAAGGGFDPNAFRLGKPWTFVSPGHVP